MHLQPPAPMPRREGGTAPAAVVHGVLDRLDQVRDAAETEAEAEEAGPCTST